jgi:hypothetical protein
VEDAGAPGIARLNGGSWCPYLFCTRRRCLWMMKASFSYQLGAGDDS